MREVRQVQNGEEKAEDELLLKKQDSKILLPL